MSEQELSPISQESDFLGDLKAKLRDLSGFDTLANELTQNADDAKATQIIFDVRDAALIVENNAVFEDCGNIKRDGCFWLSSGITHKCDFCRFTKIAGADKGNQEGVTGAFGFGFVSVYQITNNPELISANHHWRMHPDAPSSRRILPQKVHEPYNGTRFVFPWATDPKCPLRIQLGVPAIRQEQIEEFTGKILASIPQGLLFLRHLRRVEIRRNGTLLKVVERTSEGSTTTIVDGGDTTSWQIFEGSFDIKAASLKTLYDGFINLGRTSAVSIAICHDSAKVQGFYYATLPTQHPTSLPIHVNASFYPQSSRKSLAMNAGYEGGWNEAAIVAAAGTLAKFLPELAKLLGYRGVWRLISQVELSHRNALQGQDKLFAAKYWDALKPVVSQSHIVYTSTEEWRLPNKVFLLESRDKESPCLPILEQLNLPIVHPDLHTHFSILRSIGVSVLSASILSDALVGCGLIKPISVEDAPQWLRNSEQHELLATEIDMLLERAGKTNASPARQKITGCAIAKTVDGMFCPPATLWNASPEVVIVFKPLGMTANFAADDNPEGIKNLIDSFDVAGLLDLLEQVPADTFAYLWTQNPAQILDIINLCADYKMSFRADAQARDRLRKLKIWPASDKTLHPLQSLVIPGNFVNPIEFDTLLDGRVVAEHHKFLVDDLKVEELTVQRYAGKSIPDWCKSGRRIDTANCHRLIVELAKHINVLQKDTQVQSALADCALIPCRDNTLHTARTVYFESEEVKELLGNNTPVATLHEASKLSVEPFLKWLGVTALPRPVDVITRISAAIQQPSALAANRERLQKIFYRLGKHWDKYSPDQHSQFVALRTIQWLPALERYDRWFTPSELHTQLQKYLFETTGLFLDVDYKQQQEVSNLRDFLQIQTRPSCELVVKHLLSCVADNKEVNRAVYSFLNEADQLSSPAINRLKGKACLPLKGVGYVRPDEVFWREHKFNPYLYSLQSDFDAYRDLLKLLQVREEPQGRDAINVLHEIANSNDNKRLTNEQHAIVMACWTLIRKALEEDSLEDSSLKPLSDCRVIPNKDNYLQSPRLMFFADKPNLAERFDVLKDNVIVRTLSAGAGMEAAGVRLLSQAVKNRLVERTNPKPADDLQDILHKRRYLIERVINPARTEDRGWNIGTLQTLKLEWCSELTVEYTLKAFNGTHTSDAESADTFHDAANEVLYIRYSDDIPWFDIASSLAQIMNPNAEEGTVAGNLCFALNAPSTQKGEQALDKLKVPPFQADEDYEAALSTPAGMGGLDTSTDDSFENDINIDDGPMVNDVDEEKQQESEQIKEPDQPRTAFTPNKTHQVQRPDVKLTGPSQSPLLQPTPQSGRLFVPDTSGNTTTLNNVNNAGTSGRSAANNPPLNDTSKTIPPVPPYALYKPRQPVSPARHTDPKAGTQYKKMHRTTPRPAPKHDSATRADYAGRLRSYVFSASASNTDQGIGGRNTEPIDKAGMARVLVSEEQAGRFPEAMSHNNPGYDVYSLDATGENERYIEVKSLASGWQIKGVLVSSTQFRMAQDLGPKFWLYVVERAEQDDFCITRIQNPAHRVNEYMFDNGWRICAESTLTGDEATSSE